jgi:DNA-binding beta-propeller fold protein YncE
MPVLSGARSDGDANGDAAPLRTIQGRLSQLDWPMGVAVDEVANEIIVANNGDNSVLIFPRTANGDGFTDAVDGLRFSRRSAVFGLRSPVYGYGLPEDCRPKTEDGTLIVATRAE